MELSPSDLAALQRDLRMDLIEEGIKSGYVSSPPGKVGCSLCELRHQPSTAYLPRFLEDESTTPIAVNRIPEVAEGIRWKFEEDLRASACDDRYFYLPDAAEDLI